MTPELVVSVMKSSLLAGAMVMAPILLTGLVVGVLVGALQGATQINEPTMTFVPKVLAVGTVSALILPWGLDRFILIMRAAIAQAALVAGA